MKVTFTQGVKQKTKKDKNNDIYEIATIIF